MKVHWHWVVLPFLVVTPNAAIADDTETFYSGKTITINVGGGLGAGLGIYCQLIAGHWSRHIPGKPSVICKARDGAGGALANDYMYNAAPRDGTAMGLVQSSTIVSWATAPSNYDMSKFIWLGSASAKAAVLSVWHTAPAKTVDEAKRIELLVGSTGRNSETYVLPALMNELLGTKFKIITGYRAEDIDLAMERGEVHGRRAGWYAWKAGKPDWLKDHKINHLVQLGPKIGDLPQVPSLRDLVKSDDERRMVDVLSASPALGVAFYLPPEAPTDRVAALKKSFVEAMKDPDLLSFAAKRDVEIAPVSASEIQAIVEDVRNTPRPLLDRISNIVGSDEAARK